MRFFVFNFNQIKEPEDFKLWHETMVTEFPERIQRLLAGPMWSGVDAQDIRNPLKVRRLSNVFIIFSQFFVHSFNIFIFWQQR